MIDHKANINCSHKGSGTTALYLAAQNNHEDVTKLLLNSRAEVNTCRNDRRSPLYNAVKNGNKVVIKTLIEYKADVTVKTKSGTSIFDITDDDETLKLLEGAKTTPQLR